jgi:hypothetical protein
MGINVVFPEELLIALKMEPETFRKQVLVYTLGKLKDPFTVIRIVIDNTPPLALSSP